MLELAQWRALALWLPSLTVFDSQWGIKLMIILFLSGIFIGIAALGCLCYALIRWAGDYAKEQPKTVEDNIFEPAHLGPVSLALLFLITVLDFLSKGDGRVSQAPSSTPGSSE